MSCTTCGSSLPCNCANQVQTSVGRTCVTGCSCGNAGCAGCNQCCSPSLPATPTPYYQCAPACKENHKQTLVQQQFYFDITNQNTWNVPGCGETAVLSVPGLRSLNVGSYIWNSEFGYFEVTAVDVSAGQITVLNHCNDGNAAAGTNVPACTLFTVTVPPCDCNSIVGPCVAIDFTAPDVDTCILITLTNTDNLLSGQTVQIGSGFYFLDKLLPNNVVKICNQGSGITPGTPVIAKDADGNYQYCLAIISTNPCESATVTEGNNIVCDGESNNLVPLSSAAEGYVLTAFDNTLENAAYRPLGVSECSELNDQLNIVSGTATYNNVLVTDSSIFIPTDIVRIGNRTDRATITAVPDATHISFTLDPVPGANESMPDGTLVCPIDCCESITNEIEELPCSDAFYDNYPNGGEFDGGSFSILHTATPGDETYTSPPATYGIANDSECRDMAYLENVVITISGSVELANTDPCNLRLEVLRAVDGNPDVSVVAQDFYVFTKTDAVTAYDLQISYAKFTGAPLIAPGGSVSIVYKAKVTITASMSGAEYDGSVTIQNNLLGVVI